MPLAPREDEPAPDTDGARFALEPNMPEHRDAQRLEVAGEGEEEPDTQTSHRELELTMGRVFLRQQLTMQDLHPFRVRVAYRWMREVSVLKSLVAHDQTLTDGLLTDRWDAFHDGDAGALPDMNAYARSRLDVVEEVNAPDGVPLLPPRVPEEYLDNGAVSDRYDPEHDEGLAAWLRAFRSVTAYLGVVHASVESPDEGRYGLYGMFDPRTVRLLFPSVQEILTWEDVLVREVWRELVASSREQTRRSLHRRYGLADVEIQHLLRMAAAYGLATNEVDLEIDRAVACARLEDLARRCREVAGDERAELSTIKAWMLAKGITRSEPEDAMKEFAAVIRRVSAPQKVLDAPAPQPRLGPGS